MDIISTAAEQCQLKLEKLFVSECRFSCPDTISADDIKLRFDVKHKIDKFEEFSHRVEMKLTLNDIDGSKVKLELTLVGIFNTTQGNLSLIERNSLAIMFPYARSYVSLVTAQPGMAPIVLPPMNIVALLAANQE